MSFPAAQLPGDLNILVVGWKDTTSYILSIKDSAGNTYKIAAPRLSGVGLSQTIRYAPNIVEGPNTITVTFNQAVPFPDVRIIEYGGPTTLDVSASARGNSLIASSGLVTTTAPEELLVSANTVATGTAGAGSGFKMRLITSPNGDIVEDGQVSVTGSFSATAPLTSSTLPSSAILMLLCGRSTIPNQCGMTCLCVPYPGRSSSNSPPAM